MATTPRPHSPLSVAVQLRPFLLRWSQLVASWVRDEREACWLAPQTPPPITAASVAGWQRPGCAAFVLVERTAIEPERAGASDGVAPDATSADVNAAEADGVTLDPAAALCDGPTGCEPLAYGEINVLNASRREYWLGHLIVDPRRRGRGLGTALTRLLARRAHGEFGARRVSLVVFVDNRAAVHCYRQAGFVDDGFESHEFPAYGRTESLLRMVAPRFV